MLPRQHRITKDKDFETIFSKGASFFSPLFVFRVLKTDAPITRFAFVVSNKVAKRANKRNLIKRRMRAAVAKVLPHIAPGYDIAIMASAKAAANGEAASYMDIGESIVFGLEKSKLLS